MNLHKFLEIVGNICIVTRNYIFSSNYYVFNISWKTLNLCDVVPYNFLLRYLLFCQCYLGVLSVYRMVLISLILFSIPAVSANSVLRKTSLKLFLFSWTFDVNFLGILCFYNYWRLPCIPSSCSRSWNRWFLGRNVCFVLHFSEISRWNTKYLFVIGSELYYYFLNCLIFSLQIKKWSSRLSSCYRLINLIYLVHYRLGLF